jgi:hypothetical protein
VTRRRAGLGRAAALGVLSLGTPSLGHDAAHRGGDARTARVGGVVAPASPSDSLPADLRRSVVRWTGTKFRGRGRHEGTVPLAAGALALCGARVCGGHFVLDMRRLAVTDIPPHETVARARLTRHLRSADFFWTERHPTATFVLDEATRGADGTFQVAGALTLRGVTHPLAFPATLETDGGARLVRARLRVDRRRWGVTYRFDPIRNELVDDEIALVLEMAFPARP